METPNKTLDASGLQCPLPILRTRQALKGLEVGQTLLVIATDPGAEADFPAFARMTGHTLLETRKLDGKFHFLIRKA